MTPDKKRAILEAAARARGLRKDDSPCNGGGEGNTGFDLLGNLVLDWYDMEVWNSLTNPGDTSAMCAVLDIDTYWFPKKNLVLCCRDGARTRYQHDEKHDGTPEGKEAAQRLAATMVAAKIGGYVDE